MGSIDDKYFETAKDYGRKTYRTKDDMSFREYMAKKTFFMFDTGYKAPFSEFEKPYLEDDYVDMEQYLHDPPGFWDHPDLPPWSWPDNPWNPPPSTYENPPDGDGFIVFDCSIDGCFCPQDTRQVIATCNHTITGVALSQGGFYAGDFSIAYEANGTIAKISITAEEDAGKAVEFDIFMKAGNVPGAEYSLLVDECYDCELCDQVTDVSWDTDLTASSLNKGDDIAIHVKDGVPPFNWVITQCGDTGSGCSLSAAVTQGRTNVLRTTSNACGVIIITVTDACDDEAEGNIQVADSGEWHSVDNYRRLNAGGCGCSCSQVYTSYQDDTCGPTDYRSTYPCNYLSDIMRVASVCGAVCCGNGCSAPSCQIGPATGYGLSFPCVNYCAENGDICVQDSMYAEVYGCPD